MGRVSFRIGTALYRSVGTDQYASADMNEEGTARIGSYFMNKHFTPDDDGRYGLFMMARNTIPWILSLTHSFPLGGNRLYVYASEIIVGRIRETEIQSERPVFFC